MVINYINQNQKSNKMPEKFLFFLYPIFPVWLRARTWKWNLRRGRETMFFLALCCSNKIKVQASNIWTRKKIKWRNEMKDRKSNNLKWSHIYKANYKISQRKAQRNNGWRQTKLNFSTIKHLWLMFMAFGHKVNWKYRKKSNNEKNTRNICNSNLENHNIFIILWKYKITKTKRRKKRKTSKKVNQIV